MLAPPMSKFHDRSMIDKLNTPFAHQSDDFLDRDSLFVFCSLRPSSTNSRFRSFDMLAFVQHMTGALCLLSFLCCMTVAAPITTGDENELMDNDSIFSKGNETLTKRVPGANRNNPIDATFDITNWEDLAEQNCQIMLCLMGGNRVL